MRLMVLLASRLDPAEYAAQYTANNGPDRIPYGLENLPPEVELVLGHSSGQSRVPARIRRLLVRRFAADVVHAFANRRAILAADAVYAHTEHEYLGAAAVLLLFGNRQVVLAGQTIWLYEDFPRYGRLQRAVIGRLLRRVNVLIYNSTANEAEGRRLFPDQRHQYVAFGVSQRFRTVQRRPVTGRPLIVSVGIDRARDWPTLGRALAGLDVDVRIAAKAELADLPAATVRPTHTFSELLELYGAATCVVIAVRENLHASGVTTVLEAAAAAAPVICTDAGGLREYFDADEVNYVPAGDGAALRQAVTAVLDEPSIRDRQSAALRLAFAERRYDSAGHWQRVIGILSPLVAERARPGGRTR